jgi:hypothetical protein
MCETWYHSDPDLVGTNWQMWICSDKEVVKQAHVCHGLWLLESANIDGCLRNTHKHARR